VEGVTPSGKTITKTDITATLRGYGDYIHYSDLVSLINQDPVITEFTEVLGEQAGESIDIVYRDIFVAGTNVYYAGSYADSAIDSRAEVNTAPVTMDFKNIRESLIGDKARMISSVKAASTKVGTMPVAPSFWVITHHEMQNDLEAMSGWLPAHQYPNSRPMYDEEIGALPDANMRFLITQNGRKWADAGGTTGAGTTYRSTSGSQVDVYAALVFARDAVGVCPLDGMSMKSIVKALGSAGADDPLDQRGSVGWKAHTTAAILNDLWLTRGEFTATYNPS
jgi:N4-gp56 family major capsid protein